MNAAKEVLIVGASGAVGEAVTAKCLDLGWGVIGTYSQTKPTGLAKYVPLTFGSENEVGELDVLHEHSRGVQACIFTVGIPSSKRAVVDTSPEEWAQLLDINALSFVRMYRHFAKSFRENQARIVAISSSAAETMAARNGPYTASKIALESILTTLAKEESCHGVSINGLAPALIDSPLAHRVLKLKGLESLSDYQESLPWGRPLTVQEVAELAMAIVSDYSWSYTSGRILRMYPPFNGEQT